MPRLGLTISFLRGFGDRVRRVILEMDHGGWGKRDNDPGWRREESQQGDMVARDEGFISKQLMVNTGPASPRMKASIDVCFSAEREITHLC